MGILYIKLAPRALVQHAGLKLSYAWITDIKNKAIAKEGVSELSELRPLFVKAERVIILLATSDVSLLKIKWPNLSLARMRQALPHLVEDQLINDPAECVVLPFSVVKAGEMGTVVVAQRDWVVWLLKIFGECGAHHIAILPMQCALPTQVENVQALLTQYEDNFELTVSAPHHESFGVLLPDNSASEQIAENVQEALTTLGYDVVQSLIVPPQQMENFKDIPSVFADHWSIWIEQLKDKKGLPNLGFGLDKNQAYSSQIKRWYVPIGLFLLLVLTNVVALNVQWWRMKEEAGKLHAQMVQTYRNTFPKDKVVVDPMVQLQQKIKTYQSRVGQDTPTDFAAMLVSLAHVWSTIADKQGQNEIASIVYRNSVLQLRLKPGADIPREIFIRALAEQHLKGTRGDEGQWHIEVEK